MTDAWKVLGNPTRLKLIDLLHDRPQTTSDLCAYFSLSRFAVMQHLKVLENAGVVTAERRGRYRYNHLNTERLAALRAAMTGDTAVKHHAGPLINQTVRLPAPPARVFAALTAEIGRWWRSPLGENTDARVQLEPYPGGKFWQTDSHSDTNGSLLATVDRLTADRLLGLFGPLGMDTAVSLIRFRLTPDGDQTHLQLTHHLIGDVDAATLVAFRQHWQTALDQHLRAFLAETAV